MRALLPVLALTILAAGPGTARAQSCDTLIDKVTAATAATVTERRSDYASFAERVVAYIDIYSYIYIVIYI